MVITIQLTYSGPMPDAATIRTAGLHSLEEYFARIINEGPAEFFEDVDEIVSVKVDKENFGRDTE